MEVGQYFPPLIFLLSLLSTFLLGLAVAVLSANSLPTRTKSEAQLNHLQAALKIFEAAGLRFLGDNSDTSFIALQIKCGYLKSKLLRAKQKIQILKLERQLLSKEHVEKDAAKQSESFGQAVEQSTQETLSIGKSKNPTAVLVEDLLGIDDDSEHWSQPTLTPTKGHVNGRETNALSSSEPSGSDESRSSPNQVQHVEERPKCESASSESKLKATGPFNFASIEVPGYKHTSIFEQSGLDTTPSRTLKAAASHQSERHGDVQNSVATEELLSRRHTRSLHSCDKDKQRQVPPFQGSYQPIDDSEFAPEGQIPTGPRGLRVSKWAEATNESGDTAYAPTTISATVPLRPVTAEAGSVAPKIEGYHYSPYSYKYPCHYMPPLWIPRDMLLRTVTISGLPTGINLVNVMDKVRGGLVVSCSLLNTVPITGTNTAMITFFQGKSAKKYVEFADSHMDEIFNFELAELAESSRVTVSLLQTPTYRDNYLYSGIARGGWSRHLVLGGVPETMNLTMIRSKLGSLECKESRDGVLSMWREPDSSKFQSSNTDDQCTTDCVHILFSSIVAGTQAFAKMVSDDRTVLGRCSFRCERDPCDGPVEQLISEKPTPREENEPDDEEIRVEDAVEFTNGSSNGDDDAPNSRAQPVASSGYSGESHPPTLKPEVKYAIEAMANSKHTLREGHSRELTKDQTSPKVDLEECPTKQTPAGTLRKEKQAPVKDHPIIPGHATRTQEPLSVPFDDWLAEYESRMLSRTPALSNGSAAW